MVQSPISVRNSEDIKKGIDEGEVVTGRKKYLSYDSPFYLFTSQWCEPSGGHDGSGSVLYKVRQSGTISGGWMYIWEKR